MITDREMIMAIVDNDCLQPSDAIILLEGDGFNRFQKAADLYHQGMGKKVVFSGNIVNKEYGSYPFEEIKPFILTGCRNSKDGNRERMEETCTCCIS